MVESIREEVEMGREMKRLEEEKKAAEERRRRQDEMNQTEMSQLKPTFVSGLPTTIPTNIIQKGFNFVRQLSTSTTADRNERLAEEMVADFLDDFGDEDETEGDETEQIIGPIGTPKHTRVKIKKRNPSVSEENDEIGPMLEEDFACAEGEDHTKEKKKTRRKRTKAKRKDPSKKAQKEKEKAS